MGRLLQVAVAVSVPPTPPPLVVSEQLPACGDSLIAGTALLILPALPSRGNSMVEAARVTSAVVPGFTLTTAGLLLEGVTVASSRETVSAAESLLPSTRGVLLVKTAEIVWLPWPRVIP